jgi:hypothetical protein
VAGNLHNHFCDSCLIYSVLPVLPVLPCPQVTIAYPDEGAWKRFHYQFKDEGYPEVICTKVRDGAKRIVRLKVS